MYTRTTQKIYRIERERRDSSHYKRQKKTDYYFVDTISHDPEQMDVFQKSNFLEKKY
jgi:hypothetical protein